DGLGIGDRAQVAGDLEAAAMRLVDRRPEFVPRDVRVRFERCGAPLRPERHRLACVVGPGQSHEGRSALWVCALEVRTRHVHVRTWDDPRLDVPLEPQISIWSDTARGADGRHPARQVESWRGKRHLLTNSRSIERAVCPQVRTHEIPGVIVHAHDAGDHRSAPEIKDYDSGRIADVRTRGDSRDAAVFDHDIPIEDGWVPGAIHDLYVFEYHVLAGNAHVLANLGPEGVGTLDQRQQTQRHWQHHHPRNGSLRFTKNPSVVRVSPRN